MDQEALSDLVRPRPRHGGPQDRGSADAYYGRPSRPHYYEGRKRIEKADMTPEQISDYHTGYAEEDDRKRY